MSESGFNFLTLADAAKAIRSKEISPLDLTRFSLDKVSSLNSKLNAFLTVSADEALATAKRAEREIHNGNYIGPMHGIPYSVKDIYATQGIRTTNGSSIFERISKCWLFGNANPR